MQESRSAGCLCGQLVNPVPQLPANSAAVRNANSRRLCRLRCPVEAQTARCMSRCSAPSRCLGRGWWRGWCTSLQTTTGPRPSEANRQDCRQATRCAGPQALHGCQPRAYVQRVPPMPLLLPLTLLLTHCGSQQHLPPLDGLPLLPTCRRGWCAMRWRERCSSSSLSAPQC